MSGSFYGLEISKTGLFASRSAINTTGHNISNANTEGYTRQRVSLESIDPYTATRKFLAPTKAEVGGGVDAVQIEQIRSSYLDKEIRRENADMGYWSVLSSELEYVETVMNEMSDTSISESLSDFYASLNTLSQNPESSEMRTIVQQEGIKLSHNINHTYEQLVEMQKVMNESLNVTATDINAKLDKIAVYNEKIITYELGGQPANDLRDKRNLVLDELSELVNIDYEEDADGNMLVSVEGQDLVTASDVYGIDVVPGPDGVVSGETGFYSLEYSFDGSDFQYSGGELEGYRFLRDSNTSDEMGIPKMLDNLNVLARQITQEFNNVHSSGWTMATSTTASQTGINLFQNSTGNIDDVTARNMAVSDDVLDDINNIAASDVEIDLSLTSTHEGNNRNALNLIELTNNNIAGLNNSTFEDYIESLVVDIAIDSGYSQNMNDAQDMVVSNIEDRRQSISGVSLDEEMSNLVKFQYSYAASSRMINVVDEALDILINNTGLVGR